MKKNNVVKLVGIALVVAIMSTGLFYGLFVNKLSSNTGSGKTLLVAAKSLKAGSILQESDVLAMPWPAPDLPKGGYGDPKEIAGATLFDAINEGEPIFASKLTSGHGATGSGVPAGMRAVSVHVTDSTGVLAMLHSGHHVDVQVVHGKGNDLAVRTALENLAVLSVTPQAEQSSQGASLPVVTLLASPSEADVLGAADSGARVRLLLRNPGDAGTRVRASQTLDGVMRTSGSAAKPESAKPVNAKPAAHP
jgi:Flp pilus assembly protein CpaB